MFSFQNIDLSRFFSFLYFYDFATFSHLDTIYIIYFFRKGSKMYDMIWYWLNFWLNPLRVSPLVGGRWVFQLSDAHHARVFSFTKLEKARAGPWTPRAPRVGSVCRTREEERAVEVPRIEGLVVPSPRRHLASSRRRARCRFCLLVCFVLFFLLAFLFFYLFFLLDLGKFLEALHWRQISLQGRIAICGPVRQPAADQICFSCWLSFLLFVFLWLFPLQGFSFLLGCSESNLIRCLFETCPWRDSLSGRQLERPSGLCSDCFSDCYITHECSEWMPRVLTLLWSLGASVRGPSNWRRFLCPPRAEKRNCFKCSMRCWFHPQPAEGWEGNRTATSAAPPPLHCRQISLRVSRWRSAVVCTLKRAPEELVQQEKANIEIFQRNWPGTFRANPKREKEGMMRCSGLISADDEPHLHGPTSAAPPPHPPPRCRFFLDNT